MLKIDWLLTEEQLQNRIAENRLSNMDFGTLGLLLYLLTIPDTDTINFNKKYLYHMNKADGRKKTERYWNNLLQNNYLLEYKHRNGQFKYSYIVTDFPFSPERIKDYDLVMLDAGYERKE